MHSESHLIRVSDGLAAGVVELIDQVSEVLFLAVTRVAQAVIGDAIQLGGFAHG